MSKNAKTSLPGAMDPASCTCANLRKAARVVTQLYDAALQPTGLTSTQFTVLATLSKLGDLPLTRLAEALVMDRTTLTRNLKPLVGKGFVRTDQDTDLRVRRLTLTDAGASVFKVARPRWARAQSRMVEGLGQARWSGLLADLTATVAVVRDR